MLRILKNGDIDTAMTERRPIPTHQLATIIAIVFHLVGLTGILFFNSKTILQATPLNLLLSFVLLIWTQQKKGFYFWLFLLLVTGIGFAAEAIGVNTGYLFGNYSYGEVLGKKWLNVPLLIGINWFVVIYGCGTLVTNFLEKIVRPPAEPVITVPLLKTVAIISDGATLAVFFDWLIEPVAIQLGYWKWDNKEIPAYNYICWFAISVLMMALFRWLPFEKGNKFAINLLLVQAMFFLLLRTFLQS